MQFRDKNEFRRHKRSVKHALTIHQYQTKDEDPTYSWNELPQDQRYYTYLMEIDGIVSRTLV